MAETLGKTQEKREATLTLENLCDRLAADRRCNQFIHICNIESVTGNGAAINVDGQFMLARKHARCDRSRAPRVDLTITRHLLRQFAQLLQVIAENL